MLIFLEEVRAALDLDAGTIDTPTLRVLVEAAKFAATNFLGHTYAPNATPPAAVKAAVLVGVPTEFGKNSTLRRCTNDGLREAAMRRRRYQALTG